MNQFVKSSILIWSLIFLSGCVEVMSVQLVGLKNHELSTPKWDGTWIANELIISTQVVDGKEGLIKFEWEEKEGEEVKKETMIFKIMLGEKWKYFDIVEANGEHISEKFYWGRIEHRDEQVIMWYPSFDSFKLAIEQHKIKGEILSIESKPIILKDEPKNIIRLVESGGAEYLTWEYPVVLQKLKK